MKDFERYDEGFRSVASAYRGEVDNCVRRHPETAVLVALVGGLIIGAVFLLLESRSTSSRSASPKGFFSLLPSGVESARRSHTWGRLKKETSKAANVAYEAGLRVKRFFH